MIKLKKTMSVTMALALSLSLVVSAFAADSWGLKVQGKSSEEVDLPTATYTLREWNLDSVWDDGYQGITISLVGTKSVEIEDLVGLTRGATVAIAASAEGMIDVQAFSDPDRDGIYDQRIMYSPYDGSAPGVVELPYEDGAVRHDLVGETSTTMHLNGDGGFGRGTGIMWTALDEDRDGWVDVTVSADRLFQYFGPNTILFLMTKDDELGWEGDYGWSILLMDDSQPTAPAEPEQPSEPSAPTTPPAGKVMLSPQSLTVDGEAVECEKYNIDDRNYFKLRDLASLLSGTGSQFEVGYDEDTATVSITTGQAYTPIGTELAAGVDNSASVQPSSQSILIDGEKCDTLTVYNIGGSNFFQLRELGNILGFEVDFDGDTNTAIVRSAEK